MPEKPLTNENYYFILTNNNFVFGQDWMCMVRFADNIVTPAESVPTIQADKVTVEAISESHRDYFGNIAFGIDERHADYIKSYKALFAQFDEKIIMSVSPFNLLIGDAPSDVIFDNSVATDERYLLVGSNGKRRCQTPPALP